MWEIIQRLKNPKEDIESALDNAEEILKNYGYSVKFIIKPIEYEL